MEIEKLLLNIHLVSAIQRQDTLEVKQLLDSGADVNFINLHNKNETPLHYAVSAGNLENVQLLLTRGANTEAKNVDNKKPIDFCALLDDQNKRAVGAALREFSKKSKPIESGHQVYTRSNSALKNFTKRSGTAAAGQFYETKLLTMVLFRLLHDDQVERFYLGTNLNEAGAFDDIVLRTSVGGKTHVHCLQAKHRDAAASVNFRDLINVKETKGDFHLSKYFDSFLKLRYTFSTTSDHAIFQEEYEQTDLELIIFTPALINFPEDAKCENTKLSNKFYTKQTGKTVQIKCTESLLDSFIVNSQEWHRKVVAEILSKLILSKSYDTSNLKESIGKLQNDNVLSEFSDQNVSFNCSGLLQLYNNQKVMAITDRGIRKLTEDVAKILEDDLLPTNEDHVKVVKEFFSQLNFYTEQATEDELDDIVRHDIKTENYDSDDLIYSKAYADVESWWKRNGQVPFLSKSCSIFKAAINDVKLDSIQAISLSKIRYDSVKFRRAAFIIAEWFDLYQEVKENKQFCMNIYSSIPEFSTIKIIQYFQYYKIDFKFVSIDQAEVLDVVENFAKHNSQCLVIAFLPETITNRTNDVFHKINKLIIMTKRKYDCQGKSMNIEAKSMLDLEIDCQEKLIEMLVKFQGNSITLKKLLGKAPWALIDAVAIQKLARGEEIVLSNAHFSSDHDDLIIYIDRVLIDNRNNQAIYKSMTEIREGIVVVASEPGMGKSTLLTGLATSIKSSDPSSWIVRLNLLDYSKQLHEWNELNLTIDENHAMHLLMVASCGQSNAESFEKNLFQWFCDRYKIILLVDGFDEVSPNYSSIVLQLLQIYKDCFTTKLWVTTRTGGVQKELERCLGVRAYSLKPFSMDETKLFLWNLWKTRLEIKPDQKHVFENYVQQLLSHLSSSIEYGELDLVSVPLQMKMIAMIFQDNFKEYCNATELQLKFEKIDLVSLYESFIKLQFKVVLVEQKNKTDLTKPYHKKQTENSFKEFEIKHKQAAIYSIFNQKSVGYILNKAEIESVIDFLQEVQNSTEMTGIITRVINGKPIFVHQTYAEFFAAQLICEKYCSLQNSEFEIFVEDILVKFLVRSEQVQTIQFLVGMIQKKIKDCSMMNMKTSVVFNKLLDNSPDSWKEFNSRALSLLLGIVEFSLTLNSEFFEKLKNLVYAKPNKTQTMLLLKASESGHLWLVRAVLDESVDKIDNTVDWLDNWTALHFATSGGYKSVVEYLVEKSANVNGTTKEDGQTALHMAAEKGYSSIVQILLDNGANINSTMTSIGITPLHLAAREGFVNIVDKLLAKKAEIDIATTVEGETALHIASGNGHLEIVQLLIEHDVDVNVCTKRNGSTALHLATKNNHIEIVQTLLERGAFIDVETADVGFTALHFAIREKFNELASLLLEKGASTDSITKFEGHTPLHIATSYGNTEIVQLLLKRGANVNSKMKQEGWTPLHLAARNGFSEIVTMLLDHAADIDSTVPDDGGTPLLSAVERNNLEMVKLLISRGAHVNIVCKEVGLRAIHWAAKNDCPEIIELLLANGSSIDCTTSDVDATPLHAASLNGSTNAVKTLLQYGANALLETSNGAGTPLHIAASLDHSEIIKLLLGNGSNIDSMVSVDGCTPLLGAIRYGAINAVKTLLQHGANVHLGMLNGFTPLHYAAWMGSPEIIQMLIENGSYIDSIKLNVNSTPLFSATCSRNPKAVEILLQHGANVHHRSNVAGCMPIHSAAERNQPEMIKLLLKYGSNIDCTADDGRTPLHVASFFGSINAVKILLQNGANVHLATIANAYTPLHIATRATHDEHEIIKILVDHGANINCSTSKDGRTPLYEASTNQATNTVKVLLQNGANVHLGTTDDAYMPLHVAARNDYHEIIKLLLEHGSNINSTTSDDSKTPLFEASKTGATNAVKSLLDAGADPNIANSDDGFTPLHTAAWNDHPDIIALLIKKGANVNCTTSVDGQTPLAVACQNRAVKAIKVLLNKLFLFTSNSNHRLFFYLISSILFIFNFFSLSFWDVKVNYDSYNIQSNIITCNSKWRRGIMRIFNYSCKRQPTSRIQLISGY